MTKMKDGFQGDAARVKGMASLDLLVTLAEKRFQVGLEFRGIDKGRAQDPAQDSHGRIKFRKIARGLPDTPSVVAPIGEKFRLEFRGDLIALAGIKIRKAAAEWWKVNAERVTVKVIPIVRLSAV